MDNGRKGYEDIDIPEDLDIIVCEAMKSGKRRRIIKSLSPACVILGLFIAFVVSVNSSVVVAKAMRDIPIIKDVTNVILVNESIKYALEEGYVQWINESIERDGIEFEVTRVIGDKSKLIVGFRLKGDNVEKGHIYELIDFEIKDRETNESLKGLYELGSDYERDGLKPLKNESFITIENINIDKIPTELVFSFNGIAKIGERDDNGIEVVVWNRENIKDENIIIQGNFEALIILNEEIVNIKPEVYEVNEELKLGENTFHIKELRIYPMSIEVIIKESLNENNKFEGLDNCYIEDEKGRIFTSNSSCVGENEDEYILKFNGGAFGRSKELTLYSSGMYYVPIEPMEIVVDIESETLLDGSEYGIELVDVRKGSEVQVSFETLEGYGIENISINHEESNGGKAAFMPYEEGEFEPICLTEYFNLEDLEGENILIFDINLLYNKNMKSEAFSIKLK